RWRVHAVPATNVVLKDIRGCRTRTAGGGIGRGASSLDPVLCGHVGRSAQLGAGSRHRGLVEVAMRKVTAPIAMIAGISLGFGIAFLARPQVVEARANTCNVPKTIGTLRSARAD